MDEKLKMLRIIKKYVCEIFIKIESETLTSNTRDPVD